MTYAPYEFQQAIFRPLYPYVRTMGVAFLGSSIVLMATMLYPHAPRWLDMLGRIVFGAVTALYWWVLNVRIGAVTGILIYPLLLGGLALEASPAWRRREVFRGVVALIATGFGLLMLGMPERFPQAFYASLLPRFTPLGFFLLLVGVGLLAPLEQRWPRLKRVLLGALGLSFFVLAGTMVRIGSGPAAALYLSFTLACAASALGFRPRTPRSVGWKLLRGLAFAGLVPMLALGGVAAFLAQRAIERQVRDDTSRAASGEAHFLMRYVVDARESLQLSLESPGFYPAFSSRSPELLEPHLRNIAQVSAFEDALVLDAEGQVLATSYGGPSPVRDFADQDFHQVVRQTGAGYISRPFHGPKGKPQVAVALPFPNHGQVQGMLVGLLSLQRLSAAVTPAAQRFRVQVVDQRGGLLLRDTDPDAELLSEAQVPTALTPALASAEEGVVEAFGPEHGRLLAAEARVEGTEWKVVVTQDLGVAYGAITRTSVAFVGLLAMGVVLMLVLSQFVARDVIRRLGQLREATALIARGDLGRRVPEEEDDELGELCRSFNDMASRTEAAQAELREAVRAREEFLSVASHELRTPLTPLKGFAALTLQRMEKGEDFPERERFLKALRSMSRQTDRLHRLVDDLLDTSRIQAGRFELERQQLDLVPLVREVLERFELRGQEGLHFLLEAPPTPVVGLWDGPRLEQVVTNLLSNAVRYSPQGGTVQVRFILTSDHAELQVRDEGIGIPPESLASLFQPFARASNATSRHFGGLGLGLFICREIVQRHGGDIWAESPGPHRGSSFHVRLPRSQPAVRPVAAAG
jgi:signal transduction histidine kinase